MINEQLSPQLYNSLPSIEAADRYVSSNYLVEKMSTCVGELFIRHGISQHWGISLLHRHWDIEDEEVPGEVVEFRSNLTEYIMKPRRSANFGRYVPCVIGFYDHGPQALEFSSDPRAVEAYEVLRQKEQFLAEVHRSLLAAQLHMTFGLSSLKPTTSTDRWLVEFTQETRESIVREMPRPDQNGGDFVQTFWAFEVHAGGACYRVCARSCSGGKNHRRYHPESHHQHSD